ncbi:hypothetical protein Psed_0762 [Pseudonocardia dioxanivorans CB1190]|uniref:Uncharacterized protein n=1 Tax=Pseudonocardia dioxanivorans (strain ATCC 55486 / DSM 44775 / JCM 13855 / CB1190) TaxID=675635 RepID=F4CMA8_PSEUX|nr:hypothetical protein Psed_0762 [Pseudonocardia dioxanivorans CB1190]
MSSSMRVSAYAAVAVNIPLNTHDPVGNPTSSLLLPG